MTANRVAVGAKSARVLDLAERLDLPADIRDDLAAAEQICLNVHGVAKGVQSVDVAKARIIAAAREGKTPDPGDVAAVAAWSDLNAIISAATNGAQSELATVIAGHADEITHAIAEQWHAPAVAALTRVSAWWTGETSGQLFTAGRDAEAEQLRAAETSHAQLGEALQARDAVYSGQGAVGIPEYGALGYARYHAEHNTPPRDRWGKVAGPWVTTPPRIALGKMGDTLRLLAEGVDLWLPTLDEAADEQRRIIDEFNRDGEREREAKRGQRQYVRIT
ncbi:hypothetical protein [Dietzia timorensis]|uniref:Uncharacterized protein n=1 Tax=Dietzia timorensis TaxID=499555 RepID=A0A173LHD7_9ACTN|nr:hypothetical protein [Dietzia timorensis]ANI91675.1 Hypothetical protein BJL86_0881 [Dietzia timorensis]